jgi:DNA-binding NarL/FixJ family response regulator
MTRASSTPPNVHRVALVEDRCEVREQWANLLDGFEGFSCVCACSSGEEALKEIPPLRPAIVLMDIFLPGMSGIECTVRLKEVSPQSRVLILTASDDEEMVFPALEAGADGY